MSKPPVSVNNFSSNVTFNNQDDQKHTDGRLTKSPNMEPEKGEGNTWKAAQGSTDNKKRPTMSNKESQPDNDIDMESQPPSSSHTPPVARDVSSTPKKPTTSHVNALTQNSQAEAPLIPKTAGSRSSSTSAMPSPENKAVTKGDVCRGDLTDMVCQIIDLGFQKDYILSPEKLAHVLVAVESKCGKKMVSAATNKSILREPLIVINYETASGVNYKSVNITKSFCEPFLNHHLDKTKLDELLRQVMNEYAKVGMKVTQLSENLRPVEQINHPNIVTLMAPVMKLVGDYFFGPDMRLASSKFPEPIKTLLLDIDRRVISWFGKTEGGGMKDQLQLRKNALVGFISTYSFMTIWAPKLAADTKRGAGFYAKLSSYINSYLINKIDPFVIDIMINQEHQSKKAKNYVSKYATELKLTTLSASKYQSIEAEKGSVLSSIKGFFSSRSHSALHSGATSRQTIDEDNEFNEEAARQREMQRKRIERLTEFAQIAGVDKISAEFFVFIRNKIIDLKTKDYNAFTKDPVEYCRAQLEAFKMQKGEENTDAELFENIEKSINSYHENLEINNEKEKLQRESNAVTQSVSSSKTPGKSDQADRKSEATELSSSASEKKATKKNTDGPINSLHVSEKTESDSSTSVETEKSESE